jgi:tRNA dimethylallyltransferase
MELARRIGAEIISLDSMAVYRGMDIGTAKPTPGERQAVPHYLVDVIDPWEEFSVAQYLERADEAVAAIERKGLTPLFVGGTPLYLKALLRGLFSGPGADWDYRAELEQIARVEGSTALHSRLAQVDPVAAAKLHPNDTRRLIRALEVHHATGRPISAEHRQIDQPTVSNLPPVFVLDWPREQLYRRINDRVEQMFSAGLVDEFRRLRASGRPFSRTAAQAVGYRETITHLAGQHDLPTTIELVKRHTRQFAKRQLTWFRSLSECRWITIGEPFDAAAIAAQIAVLATS